MPVEIIKTKLRELGKKGLQEIVDLNQEVFNPLESLPLEKYEERIESELAQKVKPIIYVAKDGEKMVGDSISFARKKKS